jgi:DNA-binding GntR family transcriptional regulator
MTPGHPDPADPRKHRQIYAALHARIDSGEIGPGQRLPTIAGLADDHSVARQTAAKALQALVNEGTATRYPGFGYYLTMSPEQATAIGLTLPDA